MRPGVHTTPSLSTRRTVGAIHEELRRRALDKHEGGRSLLHDGRTVVIIDVAEADKTNRQVGR